MLRKGIKIRKRSEGGFQEELGLNWVWKDLKEAASWKGSEVGVLVVSAQDGILGRE